MERAQAGELSAVPLFNCSEKALYRVLREVAGDLPTDIAVMGQLPLVEFLKTDSKFKKGGNYYTVKDRRIDFGLVDAEANVVLAIEYHGAGYFKKTPQERDAIKALLLKRAGVPLLTVEENEPHSSIRERVFSLLDAELPITPDP